MLQSYEAIYEHGTLKWISGQPSVEHARVIVTMLSEERRESRAIAHAPSARIAGKGEILGDIVASIIPPDDWEMLK
jgi:hypothetical protein